MAVSSKIKVMISSRCDEFFPAGATTTLTDIRRDLKTEIEAAELFGKKLFEVWINEETPPKGGTWDSWDVCLQAVADCDILLVISNGSAGWAKDAGGIGICHAELMAGLSTAPGKVWLVSLDPVSSQKSGRGYPQRPLPELCECAKPVSRSNCHDGRRSQGARERSASRRGNCADPARREGIEQGQVPQWRGPRLEQARFRRAPAGHDPGAPRIAQWAA